MREAGRSNRWGAIAAVLVLAVLTTGVVVAVRWWHHPQVLGSTGGSYGLAGAPRPLDVYPWLAPVARGDGVQEEITVHRVRALFSVNTAQVTAKYVVCRRHVEKQDDGTIIAGFLSLEAADSLDPYCTRVRPVRAGTTLRLRGSTESEGGEYLVAVLTPHHPGAAHLRRLDVDYSRGARHLWQRGTQHVDQDLLMRVSKD